jgi:adenine deaminase
MVRDAVAAGIAPEDALVMSTLNPATWHGLGHLGAVAPGYQADLLLLPDLESFVPETVLKRGRPVGEIERVEVPDWVKHTVRVRHVAARDFAIPWDGGKARVIGVIPDQILTESLVDEPRVEDGHAVADPERDLAKIAVVERHLGTGRMGIGLVRGFGLRSGALASTFSHDAHNIVVVGVDDQDMARAIARLTEIGGGVVVVEDRGVRAELPLPIAGIISAAPLDEVVQASEGCIEAAAKLGCTLASPFQTMAFLALSVIPSLKLTDHGLVDVDRFELVPLEV